MLNGEVREDARRLLRVAYERQVASGAEVTRLDLTAGAEERGLGGARLASLVDFMEVVGWVEVDPFVRGARGDAGVSRRRITTRGLKVLREE